METSLNVRNIIAANLPKENIIPQVDRDLENLKQKEEVNQNEDSFTKNFQKDSKTTLEERLSQVISADEMKNLLSMLMRIPNETTMNSRIDLRV
ncbi:MAG TPA: hypothetical protein PK079_04225 [Leptospiraceae bacterium]|nr:hypothetical protein [Leptospiraceae bacterium]HMW05444.1 hypothetical protein [Leptospiraceae bacterium]HMX31407.1 hypothetical protein [Leptospiraceae bacterium]HMY30954.1 hypothetical protein [Leptospiraceae bacterium]HMZ63365.1 hypothetical protein [Leptospiraceae bacterium]